MAPESSNWLSFSLSPMEMLSSSSQAQMLQPTMKIIPFDGASGDSQQYYFLDNFYANGTYIYISSFIFFELVCELCLEKIKWNLCFYYCI